MPRYSAPSPHSSASRITPGPSSTLESGFSTCTVPTCVLYLAACSNLTFSLTMHCCGRRWHQHTARLRVTQPNSHKALVSHMKATAAAEGHVVLAPGAAFGAIRSACTQGVMASLEEHVAGLIQSLAPCASRLVRDGVQQVDAAFEEVAYTLGMALGLLGEQRGLLEQAQDDEHDQGSDPQQPGQPVGTHPASSTTSSSSAGTWTEQLLDILWACIRCRHPAVGSIMVHLLFSSSGMGALLAQPQLLADLVTAACGEPQGRSLAPLQQAVTALVEQSGSALRQMPVFGMALQQQLRSGSHGAGQLLWGLTDTPAGRLLVMGEPSLRLAAVQGASACRHRLRRLPEPGGEPSAHAWAAALVALLTSDDSNIAFGGDETRIATDVHLLLRLQLPGAHTAAQNQQQAWELLREALGSQYVRQRVWHSAFWVAQAAGYTTHQGAVQAAGAVLRVLLARAPLTSLVPELLQNHIAPASLQQLQGRLEALGDTSLLEGVAAMLQRLREEDRPAAAAAFPNWQGLFEAAAQLQQGVVADTVESLRRAASSMAILLVGLRAGHERWLQRFIAMLSEGADTDREQVLGSAELPGVLAALLEQPQGRLTPSQERQLAVALLQQRLGQELVCSSQGVQAAVVAYLRKDGHTLLLDLGTSNQDGLRKWVQALEGFVQHPQPLGPLLLHVALPVAAKLAAASRHNDPWSTLAAAAGLQPALLTPEGGALDLLFAEVPHADVQQGRERRLCIYQPLGRLLAQWPMECVLPTLFKRFGSSNNQVVLSALQLLHILTCKENQLRTHMQHRRSAAAGAAAAREARAEAVAAGLRRLAQAGDMAELVRNMQEAAVGLAQQHQLCREGLPVCEQPPQQQPPEAGAGDEQQRQSALEEAAAADMSLQHGQQQQQQQQQLEEEQQQEDEEEEEQEEGRLGCQQFMEEEDAARKQQGALPQSADQASQQQQQQQQQEKGREQQQDMEEQDRAQDQDQQQQQQVEGNTPVPAGGQEQEGSQQLQELGQEEGGEAQGVQQTDSGEATEMDTTEVTQEEEEGTAPMEVDALCWQECAVTSDTLQTRAQQQQQEQQQQQQQEQEQLQGTDLAQQPGAGHMKKRRANSSAVQQDEADAQNNSDQTAKRVKRRAGAVRSGQGAAGSSTPVIAEQEAEAAGAAVAAAAAGQDGQQEEAPGCGKGPAEPPQQQQQQQQGYQLIVNVGDVQVAFALEVPAA